MKAVVPSLAAVPQRLRRMGIMWSTAKRLLVCEVLLASLLVTGSAGGQTPDDARARPEELGCFAGPQLDYGRWDTQAQGGGTIQVDGKLHLSTGTDAKFSEAKVYTHYRFTGDFDVQADCELSLNWDERVEQGGGAHLSASMGVWANDPDNAWVGLSRNRAGGSSFVYSFMPGQAGLVGGERTGVRFATLRIVRRGERISFAYDLGDGWLELGAIARLAQPVHICFSAHSVGVPRAVSAEFSNYCINTGATSYRPLVWRDEFVRREDLFIGGWAGDYLAAMIWGKLWPRPGPVPLLRKHGMEWIKPAITTVSVPELAATPFGEWARLPWRNKFWSCREWGERILREAQEHGMRLALAFYLSDTAANAGIQEPPAAWRGLSVDETARAVEEYCYETARYFAERGLRIELYEIGNEIQWGILGFRPGERVALPAGVHVCNSIGWLRTNVWNVEAKLLKAAIAGVHRANPEAATVVHITGLECSPGDVLVTGFFEAMVEQGVPFDHAGLSLLYPIPEGWALSRYGKLQWFQRLDDAIEAIAALGKGVIICECGYPMAPAEEAARPMPDYPYSPDGQAAWVRDHLRYFSNNRSVKGFFYWYPDGHRGTKTPYPAGYIGLFAPDGSPLPALREYEVDLR